MPFYEKGDVRIRYEEAGSGFPLLVTPGGGLNSRVSNWPTAVINAIRAHLAEFGIVAPVGHSGVEQLLGVIADPNDKRLTASQIASASAASVLLFFT